MGNSFDIQGPTFTIEPPHHLEFTNIVDNHVDCVAKGSPPPKIEWLHLDNTPVTTIPRVSLLLSNNLINIAHFWIRMNNQITNTEQISMWKSLLWNSYIYSILFRHLNFTNILFSVIGSAYIHTIYTQHLIKIHKNYYYCYCKMQWALSSKSKQTHSNFDFKHWTFRTSSFTVLLFIQNWTNVSINFHLSLYSIWFCNFRVKIISFRFVIFWRMVHCIFRNSIRLHFVRMFIGPYTNVLHQMLAEQSYQGIFQ